MHSIVKSFQTNLNVGNKLKELHPSHTRSSADQSQSGERRETFVPQADSVAASARGTCAATMPKNKGDV